MMSNEANERLKYTLNMCHLGHGSCDRHIFISKFISIRIKKDEVQGNEKCHAKIYDDQLNQWKTKIYTQHVPLRQNTEEKVRGTRKGLNFLKAVWDDENE